MVRRPIIGIDPGKSGAWAAVYDDGMAYAGPVPMAGKLLDIGALVEAIRDHTDRPTVIIEHVGAMPGQGVTSMFSFGTSWGQVIGMCQALGWSYQLVRPQRWQGVVLAGLNRDDAKAAALQYVRARFPALSLLASPRCKKPHDGMVDAVCLACFGANPNPGATP